MRRLVAALALTTALPLLAAAPPVAAAPAASTILSAKDATGDVAVNAGAATTNRVRRSIDLRSIKLYDRGTKIRFEITIRRALPRSEASQEVYVTMNPVDPASTWRSQVSLTVGRTTDGFALYQPSTGPDADGEPGLLSTSSLPFRVVGKGTIRIDVPKKYLPTGSARLKVRTLVGDRPGSPTFSRDTFVVPGNHSLA